ncbi:Peroxidase, family 2-domain-containing protein [Phialemonium atrogriseum]|uniref:Peroxidase, family 2-domain-containing protein n=1 Tax=Phialemonium atrogriseum TaxID=1093897 RepID=A0AAJ0FJC6_9PEZI|nr:Peroxidase, family 2-domain-containing protein [Phialemonium atrogriseum]KAK1765253.1 Peroxidase, family 2-domain-containing protein [Phialemonium atrogriseum]
MSQLYPIPPFVSPSESSPPPPDHIFTPGAMHLNALATLTFTVAVSATCEHLRLWQPPTILDRRSPCPMINSLANHGFLPRNGLNISTDDLVNAFHEALNLSPGVSLPVAKLAVTTSTTGNPNTLNLDDLDEHGVLEHDGSLSRDDTHSGDNHSFNTTIFRTTAAHFGRDTISISDAAAARSARVAAAKKANPAFNLTDTEEFFSFAETALYMRVFGRGTEGHARTKWVEVMFYEERLPYLEGFRRSTEVLTNDEVGELVQKLVDATKK